ncbi:MAG TPA: hypothetical protein VFA89_23065 [Terriglobales bacterium]|nr:hypothetical protein [Terriglobales bacterium]
MAEGERIAPQGRASALVWWSMCAGPLAWGVDLGFSYSLTQHSCSTGHHYVLHVISVICFLIALTGFAVGLSEYLKLPPDAEDHGRRPIDRAHFQVLFGIVFSLSFAVVVIAGAVPRWIFTPCD